jgi:type I restriction enzyme S subunit
LLAIDAATNQSIIGIIPKKDVINNKYLWYYLQSQYWNLRSMSQGSVQLGLTLKTLKFYPITLPLNIDKQIKIVNFIENHTSYINQFLEKKQKLIELLQLKRQALIDQTITKGLVQVPIKESGIKWIGKVAEHWKINKIKNTTYVKTRIRPLDISAIEFVSEDPYLISGTDFENGNVNWNRCRHISKISYEQDPYIQIKNDDVLITKDGTVGKLAYINNLPKPASINLGIFVIRSLNNSCLNKFIFWILNSTIFKQYFEFKTKGTKNQHLYQKIFENFIFPFPPLEEQKSIVKYLDKKISSIDSLLIKIETQIKKFKEYRLSLITELITGRIDVSK